MMRNPQRTVLGTLFALVVLVALSAARSPPNGSFGTTQRSKSIGSDLSISSVSVLLPQSRSVKYKLEAFNGCFEWSVLNPDVVDLEIPEEERECARRIFIRPSERYNPSSPKFSKALDRERTLITAVDKVTQRLLRAEIFTDRLARFEVLTTNRNLRKDDIEVIGIQAYDTEGNTFSTLDGLEFIWTVQTEPPTSRGASHLLQLVPIKGSYVEASQLVLDMEANGKQSSFVLAQAKATGKVVVSARLVDFTVAVPPSVASSTTTDASSQAFMSQTVVLSILEPLNLVPAAMIYLAPYSGTTYTLQTIERDSVRNISMPNSEYEWSTTNPTIATVDASGVVSTHGLLGNTIVDVRFTAVDDNHAHARIAVVEPQTLDLTLNPPSNYETLQVRATSTYIISDIPYRLEPILYDAEGNKIFSSANVKFEWKWDDSYLSPGQDELTVLPKKLGITSVRVSVDSIGRSAKEQWKLSKKLEHVEEVNIVSPLVVTPSYSRIVLPYHPTFRHSLNLKATGGSGIYSWTTGNRNVGTVTANGVFSGMAVGNDTLTCADGHLSYNKIDIPVTVAVPTAVGFVTGPREAEIDSPLILGIHLTGVTADGHPVTFDNCSILPMSANLSNQEVFGLPSNVPCPADLVQSGACACIQLQAIRTGKASIKLSFDSYDPSNPKHAETGGEKKRITATQDTVISVFRPVKVFPPQVILAHSASLDITISGGPMNWQSDVPVVPQFFAEDASKLSIESIGTHSAGLWKYRLTCTEYGEQFIRISVGNQATATNPEPVTFHQSLKYACMEPSSLVLHPHNRAFVQPPGEGAADTFAAQFSSRAAVCADDPFFARFDEPNATLPSSLLTSQYKLRVGASLPFNLTVLDIHGRRFDNFSSLAIDWHISNPLVSFAYETTTSGQDAKRDRTLVVGDDIGSASITVAITGFDPAIGTRSSGLFSSRSSTPTLDTTGLSRTYELAIAKNAGLDPAVISLYHHHDNRALLRLVGGSGDALVRTNGTRVIATSADPSLASIVVQPLKAGVARVTAVDICLVGSKPSHSIVRVSDVSSIRIFAPPILQLGHRADIEFQLLDSYGHAIDHAQLKLMDLKLHLEGDALLVGDAVDSSNSQTSHTSSHDATTDSSHPSHLSSSTSSVLKGKQSKRIHAVSHLVSEDRNAIRAIGSQEGVATISIVMTNAVTGVVVSSSLVQIQVFPALQVFPQRLELLPGASFQLEPFGGPPTRSHLSFASSNHSLVSVSADGLVMSRNLLGACEITVTAHVPAKEGGFTTDRVWTETVQVVVKSLHGILIHSSTTRLLVGEEIVVRVVGADGESPFIWSGINLSFQWEAVNPSILGLGAIYEPAGVSAVEEQGQAIVVKALAPGTTRLSARLLEGPSFLSGKSASLSFDVVPVLSLAEHRSSKLDVSSTSPASSFGTGSLVSPKTRSVYGTRGASGVMPMFHQRLLLAPHTRHSVKSNLVTSTYSQSLVTTTLLTATESTAHNSVGIQADSTIQLLRNEDLVISTGSAGSSVLQIQDKSYGQQLLVHIAVKPINHVELRARSPAYRDISVGSSIEFDIVLRDDLGQPFDSYEGTDFVVHFSRHEFVHAEILASPESAFRKILRVKGVRPGTTMIQLMEKNAVHHPFSLSPQQIPAKKQHFHSLRVANAILPLAPVVHVGGLIRFNVSLAATSTSSSSSSTLPQHDQTDFSGRTVWTSSKPNVVRIDPLTGVATALAPGKADILYNTTVFTSTLVRSVAVAVLEMDRALCSALSNIVGQNTSCFVPLTFRDNDGSELVDFDGVTQNIVGHCGSSHAELIDAEFIASSADHDGRPVCKYSAHKPENVNEVVNFVTLTAAASDMSGTYLCGAQKNATIPFTSAFIVLGDNFQLTPSNPYTDITVFSTEKLLLKYDDRHISLFAVSEEQNTYVYRVSVPATSNPFAQSYIEFANNATRQREVVVVSYNPDDDGLATIQDEEFGLLTILVVCVCIVLALAWFINVLCFKSSS